MADYTFDNNIFTPSGVAIALDTPSALLTDLTIRPMNSSVTFNPDGSGNPRAIETESTVTLNPTESTLHSDSVVELKPTKSDVKLDVLPTVSDVCTRVVFAPVPRTRVRQPYRSKVAFRFLHLELFSICAEGELLSTIEAAPEKPRVVWGEVERADGHRGHGEHHGHAHDHRGTRRGGGLRIRFGS